MASPLFRLFICSVLVLMSLNCFVEALREFKVGDEFGWQSPPSQNLDIYTHWATTNRFLVGDSLNFEYRNDSVVEVDKWGYFHCNTTNSIAEFNDGNTIIDLDRSGAFYFISGDIDHCRNRQKLIVEVMGIHHIKPFPPPISISPDSYNPPATSPAMSPATSTSSGASVSVPVVTFTLVLIVLVVIAFV